MGITRRSLFPLGAGMIAWAQDQATFSTGISVVNVLATVRDKQGQLLKDLTKDDFVMEEDGRPQTIRYFSKQSDLALTMGLLVDVSGSEMAFIPAERRASYRFFNQVLREDQDRAFVFRFYRRVELLAYLTSSRAELETALNRMEEPPPREAGKSQLQQLGMFFGTALYDAVAVASDTVMRKQQGRKALIIMSDGQDTGSSTSISTAIEAAQRSDTVIYSLGFTEPEHGGGRFGRGTAGPDQTRMGLDVLRRLARETGGRYFDAVSSGKTLDQTFDMIQEELRNQYSLGYAPDNANRGYRKIRISVKGRSVNVAARDGYYPDGAIVRLGLK